MHTSSTSNPEIVTTSHIDEAHAQSEYFPMAHSADGLFRWHHVSPSYVGINCAMTGLPDNTVGPRGGYYVVYLPNPGPDVPADLLAQARAFSAAVADEQERRHEEQWMRETDAALDTAPLPTDVSALATRYGGVTYHNGAIGLPSARAWDAGDEESWAVLRAHGL